MGICYKLLLEDEWDWGLSGKTKDEALKEFESKYGGYIERIAEWHQFVVYNVEKSFPYTDERIKIIREYADRVYYTSELGTGITEIDLPVNKPSIQAEIDNMQNRRTDEDKKASEELVRLKLKREYK